MLTVHDESLFEDFETSEASDPSPAKVIDDSRTIYGSRKLGLPKDALWGQPVLCDFGEARIGPTHKGLIQPELYRAPEVLFDMDWSSAVDMWNVAVLVSSSHVASTELTRLMLILQIWDLFENRHLFNALGADNETSATDHIAEMVAYMGLPPVEYLHRSKVTDNVFNDQGESRLYAGHLSDAFLTPAGSWKGAGGVKVPLLSLEQAEIVLTGENKKRFLEFVRTMLRWLPEERERASELLNNSWLVS